VSRLSELSIKSLHGVGPARAAAYSRVGVETVEDLLMYFPRAYENRGDIKLLAQTEENIKNAVILTVATEPKVARIRRGMSLLKFRAFDDSGSCQITFFNQDYLKNQFPIGSTFRFWGKVERVGRGFAMGSPAFEPYIEGEPLPSLISVYRLSDGLTGKQVTKDMRLAMSMASDKLEDVVPEAVRVENKLCTLSFALRNIHYPESYKDLAIAKRRLIFDEFFMFALGLNVIKEKNREGEAIPCRYNDISRLTASLPYKLTGAQRRVIDEIRADMAKDVPMRRILVGDVGCGKTVCAAAAMLVAVQSGRQAALMAPTEILARQHYEDLSAIFEPMGIGCELLIGATPAAAKRKIKEGLASVDPKKRIDIVIGTQALLSDGVEFAAPGLIVTDEQHRFGVEQRATLAQKNSCAHVLVMSATPIPRSLALVLYGDLDISRIDEMPAGRQRVDTFVVDESYRARIDGFIRRLTGEGGQVYIVCPAIEEVETEADEVSLSDITLLDVEAEKQPPLKAAITYAEELAARMPELRVELMHGRMKSAEKEKIMQSFASGEVDVLVSTTVIEVGVNVPNACLMIVENAERFGLSQLHQLRGRVGRGLRKSYCVLMSDSTSQNAKRRLETMHTTYDGYKIAEVDLAMRGPGDFVGGEGAVRQSGGVKFRLADLCDDTGLMTAAFTAAGKVAAEDNTLSAYPSLRAAIDKMFRADSYELS